MSKFLASLLGVDQRDFAVTIERLEHVNLRPGIDVSLTAEIITRSRELVRSLGLDPADTTAREMYYGMLAFAEACDAGLREKLGLSDKVLEPEAASILATNASKLLKKDIIVGLQPAAIRKLLSTVPPKKSLRLLKFRSISSVLKREDPRLLYALAKHLEDRSWHAQISARLKRLGPRDVSERPPEILAFPTSWCSKLDKHSFEQAVQIVPEIGIVLLMPNLPTKRKGAVLLSLALALQAGQNLAVEALPLRANTFLAGLDSTISQLASGQAKPLDAIHGLSPSWQSVYRLLVERSSSLPEFDLILSELQWESTETRLAALYPSLDKWVDSHYLGFLTEDSPVSLHVIDVAINLVLGKKYGQQMLSHMRASLWNELCLRYMKQEPLEKSVIAQLSLDRGMVL